MIDIDEIRSLISAFSAKYDYDASYQSAVLEAAPEAYLHFAAARAMISHRDKLPLDAHFVARVAMMQAEDCGACTQLNLRMAVEAGVDRDLLKTLLDDPERLPASLRDIRDHARAVATGAPLDPKRTRRLREALGDAGFAELAVCLTGCRIFPTLKRAMNMMTTCEKPNLAFAE